MCADCLFIIPPASRKLKTGYTGFTSSVRLSVRLSIGLWKESCPLCNFHNTSWIHFILTHLIKQLQKVCLITISAKLQNLNFWQFFQICYFHFVFFWLGIQYDSIVWITMRRRGYPQNAGILFVLVFICDFISCLRINKIYVLPWLQWFLFCNSRNIHQTNTLSWAYKLCVPL